MAEVLREYAGNLFASDIHDYGYADTHDFLGDSPRGEVDWIITNPPFKNKAEQFALRALDLARMGVAIFARLQWPPTSAWRADDLEGKGRWHDRAVHDGQNWSESFVTASGCPPSYPGCVPARWDD